MGLNHRLVLFYFRIWFGYVESKTKVKHKNRVEKWLPEVEGGGNRERLVNRYKILAIR